MKVPWWKKKEYWGIAGVIGAIMAAIPGLQIPGVAITAGVSAGMYYFGVKDGDRLNTPTGMTNAINKFMK